MKQLQRDFTTPEQAQRLLALGVPRESANCALYTYPNKKTPQTRFRAVNFRGNGRAGQGWRWNGRNKPAWTAGRLMEIIDICALGENSDPNTEEYPTVIKVMNKLSITYVEYLVKSMERAFQLGTIDFSKLED